MNADGSNVRRLTNTNNSATDAVPHWSPDGTKIAFQRHITNWDIYVMNAADGSNQTQLTTNTADDTGIHHGFRAMTVTAAGTVTAFATTGFRSRMVLIRLCCAALAVGIGNPGSTFIIDSFAMHAMLILQCVHFISGAVASANTA